jgi:hypothetical protein
MKNLEEAEQQKLRELRARIAKQVPAKTEQLAQLKAQLQAMETDDDVESRKLELRIAQLDSEIERELDALWILLESIDAEQS